MPPPKISSLGRGLGEVMGGVPATIGCFPKTQSGDREVVNPMTPAKATVATVATVEPIKVIDEKRCQLPARVAVVCAMVILLLMLGVGIGLWLGRGRDDESPGSSLPSRLSEPVTVAAPVVLESQTEPQAPGLDISEFQALGSEGLTVALESNGLARIVFEAPLFTSRVALDSEQEGLLKKLGVILAKHGAEWEVVVTGHTDASPLRGSGLYRDNKELGLARAVEVVRMLMREANVPAAMLRAATAGEENSPFPGDDAESRRKNRTVTLQIRAD